jgi:hypothetical protein
LVKTLRDFKSGAARFLDHSLGKFGNGVFFG